MDKNIIYCREKRIYEFLGIRVFQKMVFRLERIIHKKDGGNNINYHFGVNNQKFAESFIKYLFFNGIIHIRNLLFLAIYFVVKGVFFEYSLVDFLVGILAIKDLYCVMLQRYNYLRIAIFRIKMNKRNQKLIDKKVVRYKEKMKKEYEMKFKENDLLLVRRLKEGFEKNKCVFVNDNDYVSLVRITRLIEND